MTATTTSMMSRMRSTGVLRIVFAVVIAILLIAVGGLGTIVMQHLNRSGRDEVTITAFKDWRVICPPAKQKDAKCVLNMDVAREGGETLLRFSFTDADPNPNLMMTVPHGVLLEQGIGLSVTGVDMKVRPYETCDAVGCIANLQVDEQTLNAMKTNQKAQIVVVPGNGKPVAVPFSLDGFDAGYAELKSANSSRSFWSFLD
jgi:invasion protein IalB